MCSIYIRAIEKACARHGVSVWADAPCDWRIRPEYLKAWYGIGYDYYSSRTTNARCSLNDAVLYVWEHREEYGYLDWVWGGDEYDPEQDALTDLWAVVFREFDKYLNGEETCVLGPLAEVIDGEPYALNHVMRAWQQYYFL